MLNEKEFERACEVLSEDLNHISDASDQEKFYRNLYLFIAGRELVCSNDASEAKYCQEALNNIGKLVKGRLNPREIHIIRILKNVARSKFNISQFLEKYEDQFRALAAKGTELSWIPLSDEIIPLENWIAHSVDRRKKLTKINFK